MRKGRWFSYKVFILFCTAMFNASPLFAALPGDACMTRNAVQRDGGLTMICNGTVWVGVSWVAENGYIGLGTQNPTSPIQIGDGQRNDGLGIFFARGDKSPNLDLYGSYDGGNDASTFQTQGGMFGYGVRPVNNSWMIWHHANGDTDWIANFSVSSDGNVRIGSSQAPASYRLEVEGLVAGTGPYVNLSDRRLKQDIKPLQDGLSLIRRLQPVSFEWRDQAAAWQKGRKIGLIAQDVETVLPAVVMTPPDDGGMKSVAYGDLVPVLINAVQELERKVDALQATQTSP